MGKHWFPHVVSFKPLSFCPLPSSWQKNSKLPYPNIQGADHHWKKYPAPLTTRNPTAKFSWMLSWHLAIRTKPSVDNKIRLKVKVAQLCLTLCDLMDYTVHGILQARILEWLAFPFSRGSSQHRDCTQTSRIAGGFFTSWATRGGPRILEWVAFSLSSWSSWPRNQTGVSFITGRFFTNLTIREAQQIRNKLLKCFSGFFFLFWLATWHVTKDQTSAPCSGSRILTTGLPGDFLS